MSAPVFYQTRSDGFTTGPHPISDRSPAIIAHNLNRTDLPEPIVSVTVHDGESRTTYRRRVKR